MSTDVVAYGRVPLWGVVIGSHLRNSQSLLMIDLHPTVLRHGKRWFLQRSRFGSMATTGFSAWSSCCGA